MIKKKLRGAITELFDLKDDTEYRDTELSIRKNVDFKSGNAWSLVFAIFIASIGLNTNSTAVIIGAMLISPLMGPIVGIGFSLGINDFLLFKKAFRNLSTAVAISIISSTIYFFISPISEAQSELLARTSPTFYDVLIASFGGATGIVAMSRKEKGNAIPGVAIATALMPPLCTVGFGIANFQFNYVLGATYLFLINSVFIAITTYLIVRFLNFNKIISTDSIEQKKINHWIMLTATIVIIPSIVLAWFLMKELSFKSRANFIIDDYFTAPGIILVDKKVNYSWDKKSVEITTIGNKLNNDGIKALEKKMSDIGLNSGALKLQQLSIQEELNKSLSSINSASKKLNIYQAKSTELEQQFKKIEDSKLRIESYQNELKIFLKKIDAISCDNDKVEIKWSKPPSQKEKNLAESFLKQKAEFNSFLKSNFSHVTQI